jgi:hypothetical protein
MKKFIVLIIGLFALINCQKPKPHLPTYIEFVHFVNSGIETKYIRPLYISTSKLNIQLSDHELENLKSIFGNSVTGNEKEQYLNLRNDMVITDKETYLQLFGFIVNHQKFYINNNKANHNAPEIYKILADQKTYILFYKFQDKFLIELSKYLKEKKCDKKVITAIYELQN